METIYTLTTEQEQQLKEMQSKLNTLIHDTEPTPGERRKLTPQEAYALSLLAQAFAYLLIGPLGLLFDNAVPDPRP